jgi:hypothetical protein
MRNSFNVTILTIGLLMSTCGLVTAQTNERADAIELFPVVTRPRRRSSRPERFSENWVLSWEALRSSTRSDESRTSRRCRTSAWT